MDDTELPPLSFGAPPGPPEPVAPTMPAPPGINTFMPQPGMAGKIAPLAVLAAALLGGKKMAGLAQGYTQGAHQAGQEQLQQAQLRQRDAIAQQQFQSQELQRQALQQYRTQMLAQQEEARRMKALSDIKANVAKITDPKLYDSTIEAYASQMQTAGFRGVTANQLRVTAPFVAPSAKKIASDAVGAWLRNPANAAALKKDPAIVGKSIIQIDTNGDGVPENVPLMEAGRIGGIQFAQDNEGNALALKSDDEKIGGKFAEAYKVVLARFVADNKGRTPTPAEKEKLYGKANEMAKTPKEAEDVDPSRVAATATALLEGRMAPSQLNLGGGAMGKNPFRQAVMAEVNRQNPQFDWKASELDYKSEQGIVAADRAELTQLQRVGGLTDTYARTAEDNLRLALGQSKEVARTGSRLANRYLQWFQGELTPAVGLTKFENYIYTAAREYAKVVGGGAGSVAQLTDTASKQAEKLLNTAQSPEAFAAAVDAMRNDMGNVQKNFKLKIAEKRKGMGGGGQTATDTPPPAGGEWIDAGGGLRVRKKGS